MEINVCLSYFSVLSSLKGAKVCESFEMNNNLRKANKKLSQVFELKNINF